MSAISYKIIDLTSWVKIGRIKYCKTNRFTLSDNGNVFKGEFHELSGLKHYECAIKVHKQNLSKREVKIFQLLQDSPPNPHIIRYLGMERDEKAKLTYIALELCNGTLKDAINMPTIHPLLTAHHCLAQITKGIKFLHKLRIQHRDIKPQNILWKDGENAHEVRFIISYFDLCHVTDGRSSSHRTLYGTVGWMAPELSYKKKRTTAVDIFSLGCVFYYVLTLGKHPFSTITDNVMKCQDNIAENNFSLSTLFNRHQYSTSTAALAEDLIEQMINQTSSERPDATIVLQHPLFWTKAEITYYYILVGKKLRAKSDRNAVKLRENLERGANKVFQGSWRDNLNKIVLKDIRPSSFDKTKICDLLKVIRNKSEHFGELRVELQDAYLGSEEGVAEYYNEKFPKLLPYVYRVEQSTSS